jgi:hypothetical protein
MTQEKKENRKYKRIYFSRQEDLVGNLELSNHHNGLISAGVKDVSEGEMEFITQNDQKNKILSERA